MSQGSSEGVGPYGERHNDIRERFGDRVAQIERIVAAFEVRICSLEVGLKTHLEREATAAERAAVSAHATLREISGLREDIVVMKAEKGTVQVEAVQRLLTIVGTAFVIFGAAVTGLLWVIERVT